MITLKAAYIHIFGTYEYDNFKQFCYKIFFSGKNISFFSIDFYLS